MGCHVPQERVLAGSLLTLSALLGWFWLAGPAPGATERGGNPVVQVSRVSHDSLREGNARPD